MNMLTKLWRRATSSIFCGLVLVACTPNGVKTQPRASHEQIVPLTISNASTLNLPNIDEYYKLENYKKGVHYNWMPVRSNSGDSIDSNNERIDTTGETVFVTDGYIIKTAVLPDGSTVWEKIVATLLRGRGFSDDKIAKYSTFSSRYEFFSSRNELWRYGNGRLSKCFSSSTSQAPEKDDMVELELKCRVDGNLPTEYNVETGEFLGYNPYKYAERLPDCYKVDERTCSLVYSSFEIGNHKGWKPYGACKLLPKQQKECRVQGFKRTRRKPIYKCDKEQYDVNCKFVRYDQVHNSTPGCYSALVLGRGGCAPMASFEPPEKQTKTKLIFNPQKHNSLRIKLRKNKTKRLYKIAPGHYCPPADEIVQCDGREDTKIVYVEQ